MDSTHVVAVHQQLKFGADVIKLGATGGVVSEGDRVGVQQMSEEMMGAAVEAAEMAGVRVAAHAHGTAGIKAAIRMMKERDTYLVATRMAAVRSAEATRADLIAVAANPLEGGIVYERDGQPVPAPGR